MTMKLSLSLLVFVCVFYSRAAQTDFQSDDESCTANSATRATSRVPDTCTLVYAPLTASKEDWGVFSLTDRSKGTSVWNYGDVVIQVPDAGPELTAAMEYMVWDAQETGGQYEGHERIDSVVSGLGMMTRTKSTTSSTNLLPFVPRLDEGGLTRFDSPGAGATTHYHNYTWYFRQIIEAGDELTMASSLRRLARETSSDTPELSREQLLMTGYCLDNLRPRKSLLKDTGRGAFATRTIPTGSIVAPVPVLPLGSDALEMRISKNKKSKQQLLRNYCLGNSNSSTLLYPYGPLVNLINHYTKANVQFQWSEDSQKYLSEPLPTETSSLMLLMELVATTDIREGEELFLDYGHAWEDAWYQHSQAWEASGMHYTPSYVMDDAIRLLRTQQEQKDHEYPSNLFTSCFYRYSDRDDSEKSIQPESASAVTSYAWKFTRGLYDLKHLRPCEVLRRNEDSKGRSAYAVRMSNRPGLPAEEMVPNGSLHIVTHVPRSAIRFSDKAGTTDQHLESAFRHEIGLGDDVFPQAWMDLRSDD